MHSRADGRTISLVVFADSLLEVEAQLDINEREDAALSKDRMFANSLMDRIAFSARSTNNLYCYT
jgi:hypothetical protein